MTRHQIDPRQHSDSDLARHLLTVRGVQWLHGDRGVPLALLLRGDDAGRDALHKELRGHPALRQSDVDVWVTAEHASAAAILTDPRLAVRDARAAGRRKRIYTLDAATTPKHVLAVDDLLDLDHAPVYGTPELDEIVRTRAAGLGGRFDLMTDFARPAAVEALAALAGMPYSPRLADLVAGTVPVLDVRLCPPTLAMARTLVACWDGIKDMVGERHVVTLAVTSHVTANLICGTVLALLDHPDQWALLRADPSLAGRAVAETLRFDPPIRMASRIAGEDLVLGGVPVKAGDQVVVLIDAANRDPAVFAEPDRYYVARTENATLADRFVAPVASRLAAEAVRALVSRLPDLRPAGPVVRYMRCPVTGSVARCPVSEAGG
ncbi:P450-derived glycosyltransferase activator [Thermoactinospora rubra]|uniref:cytochrome P450 family protein n=1 Tax=Thermoactinospora rubra TaxID=1088767 RepID=UPI000A106807|nr:P450-derived glycosyltransferase activator [Thermoactinospora rubra]